MVPLAGAAASLAATEALRASFEQQVWLESRYASAELLGARADMGRLVVSGLERRPGQWHCDFVAQAVYGTADDFERVQAHYDRLAVVVGAQPPAGYLVQPVAAAALADRLDSRDAQDLAAREVIDRTGVDLARARTFRTVYTVEAVSWGHPAWLDWRCR